MADPDWRLVRSFLSVLRRGSLSAAARELHLSQPTLGRQVAELEAAVGRALFTRSTDGLRPTDAALELAPHAEAMAAAAAAFVRAASGVEGGMRGAVRLSASEFIGGGVLPAMLARFQAIHPGVEIELSLNNRTEDLLRRDADLAVRNTPPTQAALVARRIGEAPVCFFAHRSYAAAHGLPATVEELAGHALIGRPEHVEQARLVLGVVPHFAFRCDSDLGLLAALRAGVGVGYCQVQIGQSDPNLVPVLPGLILRHIGIWVVMHEDLRTNRRIRALFDHLASELMQYISSGTLQTR